VEDRVAKKTSSLPVRHPGFSMGVYSISARPEGGRGRLILAWILAVAAAGGGIWLLRDTPAAMSGLIGALDGQAAGLWSRVLGLFG
jgi:hypothetical protein